MNIGVGDLMKARTWLSGLELAPRDSRIRSRLNRVLATRIEDTSRDERELMDKMLLKDDAGELVVDDIGNYILKDGYTTREFNAELQDIHSETVNVDLSSWPGIEQELYRILTELDIQLSGDDAEAYDALMTALEEDQQATKGTA